jgi:hypothetical protein
MTETQIRKIVEEENKKANKPIVDKLEIVSKAVIGNGNTKDCLAERVGRAEERDNHFQQSIAWIWTLLIAIFVAIIGLAINSIAR